MIRTDGWRLISRSMLFPLIGAGVRFSSNSYMSSLIFFHCSMAYIRVNAFSMINIIKGKRHATIREQCLIDLGHKAILFFNNTTFIKGTPRKGLGRLTEPPGKMAK